MNFLTNLLIGLIIVLDLEMVFPTQPVRTSLKQQNIFQYGGNETGFEGSHGNCVEALPKAHQTQGFSVSTKVLQLNCEDNITISLTLLSKSVHS